MTLIPYYSVFLVGGQEVSHCPVLMLQGNRHISVYELTCFELPKTGILTNRQDYYECVIQRHVVWRSIWGNSTPQILYFRNMRVVTKFGICGGEWSLVKVV